MSLPRIGNTEKRIINAMLRSNQYWNDCKSFDETPLKSLVSKGYLARFPHGRGHVVMFTHAALDFLQLFADPDPAPGHRVYVRNRSILGSKHEDLDIFFSDRRDPSSVFGVEFRPTVLIGLSMVWPHAGVPEICDACGNKIRARGHYCIRCDRSMGEKGETIAPRRRKQGDAARARGDKSMAGRKAAYNQKKRNLKK